MRGIILSVILIFVFSFKAESQEGKNQLGGWYTYAWNTSFKGNQFGLQGCVQDRNGSIAGNLEQLLVLGGLTFKPQNVPAKFTLGYYFLGIGEFDSEMNITKQNIIYQDALLYQSFINRIYLTHRFRFEERFVEGQDFRTRFRYRISLNVPLNNSKIESKTIYLSLSDELFINGQKKIGEGRTVEVFDRNRLFAALGYCFNSNLKILFGSMHQTTNSLEKDQLQVVFYQRF